MLERLGGVIAARREAPSDTSYVASTLAKGVEHCAKKLGEEAVETAMAAVAGPKEHLVSESADLLFHLLILWDAAGVDPAAVAAELERREGTSGHTEKANRPR